MIEVKDIRKNYGDIEAVKGISFTVNKGEVYGLLGPNGAGKSTTISILCGLQKPSSGAVTIGGLNLFADPVAVKKIMGVVPQEVSLYHELSAVDNLMFFGSLYGLKGKERRDRVEEVLELVGLSHRTREAVGTFSGGMLRRLNIACGMIHKPAVLLLDEPTVGLDPQTRLTILETISNAATQGTAVLFTTHYLDEAEEICHRVGIIDHGKILIEGTLTELRKATTEKDIVIIRGNVKKETIAEIFAAQPSLGIELISHEEGTIKLAMLPGEQNLATLMRSLAALSEVKEISVKQPSLESLFIKLTGRELRET